METHFNKAYKTSLSADEEGPQKYMCGDSKGGVRLCSFNGKDGALGW